MLCPNITNYEFTGKPTVEWHDVGSMPGELDTDELLSKNPHARLPVVLDKNEFIRVSNTITSYLAVSYGKNTLWDENPTIKSRAERWMDWELATLKPDFIDPLLGLLPHS